MYGVRIWDHTGTASTQHPAAAATGDAHRRSHSHVPATATPAQTAEATMNPACPLTGDHRTIAGMSTR